MQPLKNNTAWNRTHGARNQSWTLSAVGDWTAHSDAGVSQTRTHAGAHELTALTTGGTTSPLSYDPKGNLATQEVSFEYDALGRRVARSELAKRGQVRRHRCLRDSSRR